MRVVSERYDALNARLQNWARWAQTWRPELGVAEPIMFQWWIPSLDFELWPRGEEAPVHERDPHIDEADAELIDRTIGALSAKHRETLKSSYLNRARVGWWRLQRAIRALGDALEP